MITRRSFIAASAAPLLAKKKEAAKKPNVLLILADDIAAWMLGCYGNQEIRTPNIDTLARTGTRFINSFAYAPVASANRPMLVNGLAAVLGQTGYACADVRNNTQQALEFLDKQQAGKPFFLMAGYDAAGLSPEKHLADYKDVKFDTIGWEPPAPNAAAGKEFLKNTVVNIRKAAASVATLDDQVQALLARLQQRALRDETLVVFAGTAGQFLGRHGLWGDGTASEPVNMFDDVTLIPMLWSWHGKIPAELARAEVIGSYDFVPSVLEAVGIAAHSKPHGTSYFRLAANQPLKKKEQWPTTVLGQYKNVKMARDSRYKLVLRNNGDGPNELYDVRVDTREKVNQYDNPGFVTVRDRLRRELSAWEKRFKG